MSLKPFSIFRDSMDSQKSFNYTMCCICGKCFSQVCYFFNERIGYEFYSRSQVPRVPYNYLKLHSWKPKILDKGEKDKKLTLITLPNEEDLTIYV